MRWTPGGQSGDVEDRRGQSYGGGFRGGPASIGVVLVLLVLSLLTGRNFLALLGPGGVETEAPTETNAPPAEESPEEKRLYSSSTSSSATRRTRGRRCWATSTGARRWSCFADATPTACGIGQTARGPFYCPADEKVYIDLGFYDELRRRFGAPGDFAQAYVIAHELGHHMQHLRGIEARVRQAQESRPDAANQLSVRLELQADCLRGNLGPLDRAAQHPRGGRRRRGAQRRGIHRRRSDSAHHRDAACSRNHSRTGRPRSEWNGSGVVSRPAISTLRHVRAGN